MTDNARSPQTISTLDSQPFSLQGDRRQFLKLAASASLGYLLSGCASQNASVLKIRSLTGSIPPQVIGQFRQYLKQAGQSPTLNISPVPQQQALFDLLQQWKQQSLAGKTPQPAWYDNLPLVGDRYRTHPVDLISIGDYWLQKAIEQQLIHPIDASKIPAWSQLPGLANVWKPLVTRNKQGQPDPNGDVWALPYRWGTTVIAYRKDIFRDRGLKPPTDWADLWRPELQRRIAVVDQPRQVIGLTLKKLGKSYNTPDLKTVPDLEKELNALHQQILLYSSDHYLQPLLLNDVWVAVGWSSDLLAQSSYDKQLAAVIPDSGTALWADLWVHPAIGAPALSELANQWIQFSWQPEVADRLTVLSRVTSPALWATAPAQAPADLQQNPVLLPPSEVLQRSEFLQPLAESTLNQYRNLWGKLRAR